MQMPFRQPRILVVAPDGDLRRSLVFMLTAEGFAVTERAAWPAAGDTVEADAVVIDHSALDRLSSIDERLKALGQATVILASRPLPFPALGDATVVRKPLLDHVLVTNLRAALAAHRTAT
ncbi:MAG: hypothetical protein JF615_11450 [Asticcacaulis sp.]|nr:hypothetical protein [Asticcacaulis sp.]